MILIQKENEGKTVKDIKSYEFYGDNPEIFHSLVGFEIADILFTHTKEENENVVVVKCANKQHVEIDLLFKEDGIFVTDHLRWMKILQLLNRGGEQRMLADDYVAERLSDYDSKIYQLYRHKNGQKASDLVEKVKNEIAECGLSATEAKGFLEYMKIVIDAQSHLPIQK